MELLKLKHNGNNGNTPKTETTKPIINDVSTIPKVIFDDSYPGLLRNTTGIKLRTNVRDRLKSFYSDKRSNNPNLF